MRQSPTIILIGFVVLMDDVLRFSRFSHLRDHRPVNINILASATKFISYLLIALSIRSWCSVEIYFRFRFVFWKWKYEVLCWTRHLGGDRLNLSRTRAAKRNGVLSAGILQRSSRFCDAIRQPTHQGVPAQRSGSWRHRLRFWEESCYGNLPQT